MGFTHLHLHTEYSLLDGAIRINDLANYLIKNNFKACAITDHGNMHGVLEFYYKMKEKGIKPIIGSEVYLNPEDNRLTEINNFHLTLLAKNLNGYKNLIKLSSLSYIRNDNKKHFYRKPRITFTDLQKYGNGLIAMTACLGGSIPQFILKDRLDLAEEYINEKFLPIFKDDFYLEIMRHKIDKEEIVIKEMKELSKRLNIPMVATNDCHYLTKEDGKFHNILLSLQIKRDFSEEILNLGANPSEESILNVISNFDKALGRYPEFYVKTEQEMRELFPDALDAVDRTEEVAEKCNLVLEEDRDWAMPAYKLPKEYKNFQPAEAYSDLLRKICEKNIVKKYKNATANELKEVKKRFEYEFKIISEKKFAQYFLIVRDFIEYAKKNNIPIGPGRGSVVGSLVAYLTDLTAIDPLRYGLLFERFLNPERTNIPDVDLDICQTNREKLIEYIKSSYNKDGDDINMEHVCQIVTFQVMKIKGVIRDVGRVLGIPLKVVNELAKSVDNTGAFTLEEAISIEPDIRKLLESRNIYKIWQKAAENLSNLVKNTSIHAAGVVISKDPLIEYIPLLTTSENTLVAQFQMADIERSKLVKWDILGLKTLTVINEAEQLIRFKKPKFSVEKLSLDDKKTYEMISNGDLQGVFQLESSAGMVEMIKRLKPKKMEELIPAISLFRPGPIKAGLVTQYIENKKKWEEGKEEEVKKTIPFDIGDILDDSYGTMIYQEHIMLIAEKLCGFSPAEADILRKAISKKKGDVLSKMKEKFISGAVKRGAKKSDVINLWIQIEKFAEYAFNKSHSTGYAYLSYWTAYLKANYPVEFFTALINKEKDFDKKKFYYENAFKYNIKILPPEINKSFFDFYPEETDIRYGLNHIKGANSKLIEDIVREREENGLFKEIFNFIKRIPGTNMNRSTIEVLIKVGAFDELNSNRASLYDAIDRILEYGKKSKEDEESMQGNLFTNSNIDIDLYASLKKLKKVDDFEKNEKLRYEKEYLGYYFSSHPISSYEYYYSLFNIKNIEKARQIGDEEKVCIIGVLTNIQKRFTKNKETFLKLIVEDLSGSIIVNIYRQKYTEYSNKFNEDLSKYLEKKIYQPMLFFVGKGFVASELNCDRFLEIDKTWEIFNHGVKIHIEHDQLHKFTNNIISVKNFMERHKGNKNVDIVIDEVPLYDRVFIALSDKFSLKITKDIYEEFKENFSDFGLTIY